MAVAVALAVAAHPSLTSPSRSACSASIANERKAYDTLQAVVGQLEQEKSTLEVKASQLEQEKSVLEMKASQLEQDKQVLEVKASQLKVSVSAHEKEEAALTKRVSHLRDELSWEREDKRKLAVAKGKCWC